MRHHARQHLSGNDDQHDQRGDEGHQLDAVLLQRTAQGGPLGVGDVPGERDDALAGRADGGFQLRRPAAFLPPPIFSHELLVARQFRGKGSDLLRRGKQGEFPGVVAQQGARAPRKGVMFMPVGGLVIQEKVFFEAAHFQSGIEKLVNLGARQHFQFDQAQLDEGKQGHAHHQGADQVIAKGDFLAQGIHAAILRRIVAK